MKIAFLGTGRMGTELALHLLAGHDVTVWNRSAGRTERLTDAGATAADSAAEAVAGADVVITCLFGPDTVREVVTGPGLLPEGVLWLDATTVGPDDAAVFAKWAAAHEVRFVHTPVVGTIGPARNGALGVYVGGTGADARATAAGLVAPWADPDRLIQVDSAPQAAAAKLLANLALAVSLQGLVEALRLGHAQGFSTERTLDLLDRTGLAFPAGMKRQHLLTETFQDAHFTADALAKDLRLMLRATPQPLPAVTAALETLTGAQRDGHGDWDISVMVRPEIHTAGA